MLKYGKTATPIGRVADYNAATDKLQEEAQKAGVGSDLAACLSHQGLSSRKAIDSVLYIVGEITQGGTINLFERLKEQQQRIGITNFDGSKLNVGYNAVIDAMSIGYDTSTSPTEDGKGLDFSKKAPAAVQNCKFTFGVEGKSIIDIPVFDAHNPNVSRHNTENYRGLGHLPVVEAQKILSAIFEFPIGITPDTTDGLRHFVRVALRVAKTVAR